MSISPTILPSPVPQLYAAGPDADLLNPLALPATIAFSATADGTGIASPPFSQSATWSWWHESGAAALAPYVADALTALRAVADAAGNTSFGAALDVINAAATPQAVREFVSQYFATTWAEAAEGVLLSAEDTTTQAAMYDWAQRASDFHASSAQHAQQDAALAVLAQPLGGGTVFSTLAGIAQLAQTTQSFQLEMTVPGLQASGGDRGDAVLGGAGADTIQTGGGWDAVLGFEGNDTISAGDGYDLIRGGAGNDSLDGGSGVDTAMYAGSLAQYTVTANAGGYTVAGPDGTDTLVGVERLRFADGLLALDTQCSSGSDPGGHLWQVAALVQAAFGRLPNAAELNHWTAACDGSADMAGLAQQMMNQYAVGMTSRDVVAHLYQQIVREQATVQVVESYAAQIGPGAPFATLADLVVYAACHPLNTNQFAHLVGTPQLLDPAAW